MAEHVMTISPGGVVKTIYSDELIPLMESLGTPEVERATHVVYVDGWWQVNEIIGRELLCHAERFKKRADAIKWEVGLLESQLMKEP